MQKRLNEKSIFTISEEGSNRSNLSSEKGQHAIDVHYFSLFEFKNTILQIQLLVIIHINHV